MQAKVAASIARDTERAERAASRSPPSATPARPPGALPRQNALQRQVDASPRIRAQQQQIDRLLSPPLRVPQRAERALPVASTGTVGAVVQRAQFTLSFPQVGQLQLAGPRQHLFSDFLAGAGYTYDSRTRAVNTGATGAANFATFKQQFDAYVLQHQVVELGPEERLAGIRSAGERRVREKYPGAEIETLAKEGKNNCGIYRVQAKDAAAIVIKVLSKGLPAAAGAATRVPALRERFIDPDEGDPIDIGIPLAFEEIQEGPLSFGLATYQAHGVMSLNAALEVQDLPVERLRGAARGLGWRVAAFHVAPIERNDVKDGSYLVHGDLNASNLMLSMDGVVGLVDVDDLKLGDIGHVKWDLDSLLGSLRTVLVARYGAPAAEKVAAQMKQGFVEGYTARLATVRGSDDILRQLSGTLSG